jgi:hypothetical protein
MRFIQKFLMSVFPQNLAAKMEAESRDWMFKCPACQYEISIWDSGGIRYKATHKERQPGWCRGCGKFKWLRLYRKSAAAQAPSGVVE